MRYTIIVMMLLVGVSGCAKDPNDPNSKSASEQFIEDATGKTAVDGFHKTKADIKGMEQQYNKRVDAASKVNE